MNAALTAGLHEPTLLEQAEGLGRAEVMKQVVGPWLTRLLTPVYEAPINEAEKGRLNVPFDLAILHRFANATLDVLQSRTDMAFRHQLGSYQELEALNRRRPELFYFTDTHNVVKDFSDTPVAVGFGTARKIYMVELLAANRQWDPDEAPAKPEGLIEIMQRPAFADIENRLTKGPFGVLGPSSSRLPGYMNTTFFEFPDPRFLEGGLHFLPDDRAFELVNGKVVGLSDEYHVSAAQHRRSIKANGRLKLHKVGDSSGCPVRHSFEAEDGSAMDPLITASREFLVRTLEVAAAKQAELEIRHRNR